MNKWFFIVLLCVLCWSCKKDSTNPLNIYDYKVYNEELKTLPICTDGFVFVSAKNSELVLEKLDLDGNKTTLSTISSPVSINELSNFTLLSDSSNNYWLGFTYSGTYNSATTQMVQVTKIKIVETEKEKELGEITLSKNFPVSENSPQYVFDKIFLTSNGGFMTVSSFQDKKNTQVALTYYNSNGTSDTVHCSANIENMEYISGISRLSDGTILLFPVSYGEGLTLTSKDMVFLDATAKKIKTDIHTSLGFAQIHYLRTFNDTTLVVGSSFSTSNTGISSTQIAVIEPSGRKLWSQDLGYANYIYSVNKFDTTYVLMGTKNDRIRTDYDFNALADGSSINWISTNLSGTNIRQSDIFKGEYLSSGVASIVNSKGELCILGTRKSFELYDNIVFVKTALK